MTNDELFELLSKADEHQLAILRVAIAKNAVVKLLKRKPVLTSA